MKALFCNAIVLAAGILVFHLGCAGRYSEPTGKNGATSEATNPTESAVSVFGWADAGSEDRELEAQMRAKQCLLLAHGATLQMGVDGLSAKNRAQLAALNYAPLKVINGYAVVELTARLAVALPPGYKQIGKTTKTVPLNTFILSITESAQHDIKEHQRKFPSISNGFLVLKKMELLPATKILNCRYELEVYAEK